MGRIKRDMISPSGKYRYVIEEHKDISFVNIYILLEDYNNEEDISYGTYWSRKNDMTIVIDKNINPGYFALNELRGYMEEPTQPLQIEWIKDYSFSEEVCFIDPNEAQVYTEIHNAGKKEVDYERIEVMKIVKINDYYIVQECGDEDEWQLGSLRDGKIICWASYGDIRNAIKSL